MQERDAGFTLPELLVSLVILGFVSAMLLQGVQSGQRVWQHIDARRINYESVGMAQLTLRERLEKLAPETRYDGSAPYADFVGTANDISFIAPTRDADAPDALQRVKLQLAANGDVRMTSSNMLSFAVDAFSTGDATRKAVTLISDVQQIEIAYLGLAAPDNSLRWRARWMQQAKVPSAIRVRLTFEPGDKRIWPDLIIRPVALMDSDCIITVETMNCRGRT
jgi:general secretion pathway protein J